MWFVNFSLLSMFLTSVSAPAHRWNSYLKRGESFKHSSKSSFTVILPLSPTQNYCSNSVFWRGGEKKKENQLNLVVFLFFFLRLHTGGSTHSSRRMVFPFKAYNLYSSGSSSRSPLSLLSPLSSSLLGGSRVSDPNLLRRTSEPQKRTTLTPAYEWAHEGKKPGRVVTIFSFLFNPAEVKRWSLWRERMLRSFHPSSLE